MLAPQGIARQRQHVARAFMASSTRGEAQRIGLPRAYIGT
jgi:hypothetical protein